jgi:hypothetical protein
MTVEAREQKQEVSGMGRRAASWLAWSLVALSVTLLVGGIVLVRATRLADPQLSPYGGAFYAAVLSMVTMLTFSVVGAIVASRHPRNTIGWIFCIIGLAVGIDFLARGYAEYWLASGSGSRSLGETAAWFTSWLWIPEVAVPTSFLLLLFPDGRLPSPRWRPVAKYVKGLKMFSRRKRAERSTTIEIRVTTAERKTLIDVCGVGEAS